MDRAFNKGEYVIYGKVGVCLVLDCCFQSFGKDTGEQYYALKPKNDPRSTLYVPCGNEKLMARLRPLLTKEEIDEILQGVSPDDFPWNEDKNERTSFYRTVLSSFDHRQLVRLIRTLYAKKEEKARLGKKLFALDETVLADAVRLVEDEFSLVLGISPSGVEDYVLSHMAPTE